MRAELQRLGVAVAALIAREVREAAVGRCDELLGIGAEGSGIAEGAGKLRELLLPALELLRCGGAVVAPEHPERLAEGYTGDLIALALEGVQNPLVERGDAQRASHGRQTISAAGGGGRISAPRAASAPPTSGWPAGPAARACRRGRHRARRPSARRAATDPDPPPSACTMAVSIKTVQRSPRSQGCSPRSASGPKSPMGIPMRAVCSSTKEPVPAAQILFIWKSATSPPCGEIYFESCPPISKTVSASGTQKLAALACAVISSRMTPALQVTPPVKTTGLWTGRLRTIVAL